MNENGKNRSDEQRLVEWMRTKGIEAETTGTYESWDITAKLPDGRTAYFEYKNRRPSSITTYPDTVLSLKKVVNIMEDGKNNGAHQYAFIVEFEEGYFVRPLTVENVDWFIRTKVDKSRQDADRHNLVCRYPNNKFTFWR